MCYLSMITITKIFFTVKPAPPHTDTHTHTHNMQNISFTVFPLRASRLFLSNSKGQPGDS